MSVQSFCATKTNRQVCEDFFKLNIGCKFFDDILFLTKLKETGYDMIFNTKEYGKREKYVTPNRSDPDLPRKTFVTAYHNPGETIGDIRFILIYFHGRGRGQIIRKILSKSSTSFIDIELPAETLWQIYRTPQEEEFFKDCFPNESVPMLYIKTSDEWVKLECYNSSEKILTILSCFDDVPITCPVFNEYQKFIFNLFTVTDRLKHIVYELGYTWRLNEHKKYVREKLPDRDVAHNLSEWKTTS